MTSGGIRDNLGVDTGVSAMRTFPTVSIVIVSVLASSLGFAAQVPEQRILSTGGLDRSYFILTPRNTGARRPVVIALHGGTRPATDIFKDSAWPDVAMRSNIILVAPQGVNNQWNDGRKHTASGKTSTADDVGFLSQLIAELVARDRADPARIFLTGASNGGMMSFRFACERADLLAGFAPTIASMPVAMREACKPSRPLAVIMIAGTADPLMTYDGVPARRLIQRPQDPMSGIPETFAFWVRVNGCGSPAQEVNLPDLNPADGSTVTVLAGVNCAAARATLLRVNGGGHREPSRSRAREGGSAVARMLGPQNRDVEAATVIWSFFSADR